MTTAALVVVDLQNDYLTDGSWPLDQVDDAIDTTRDLLDWARGNDTPIIHIRHEATSDQAPFFRPGTPGAGSVPRVAAQGEEPTVHKHRPNAFHETDLLDRLKNLGTQQVILAGAMSQMCIDATARAARDFGFDVTVAHDACAAKEAAFNGVTVPAPQVHAAFMAALGLAYADVKAAAEIMGR